MDENAKLLGWIALLIFLLGFSASRSPAQNGTDLPRAVLGGPIGVEPISVVEVFQPQAFQEQPKPAVEEPKAPAPVPVTLVPPLPNAKDRPLPINLPTALHLAQAEPLDIALASQRLQVAFAQFERAKRLWLPTLYLGGDYYRHDGQLQDVAGAVFGASKSTLMVGMGPSMVFALADALLAPLAARQEVQARAAGVQVARQEAFFTVGEAYFNVQQARAELAGALDTVRRSEEMVRRTEKLAAGLVPPVEAARTRTELARRRQAVHAATQRWKSASAELARILRLDPQAQVEPLEPADLQIHLVDATLSLDELIPIALTNRPELASQQAFVQASLERLRQEKWRPFIPSVLLRGTATNPGSTFSTGFFGGGRNSRLGDGSWRNDMDLQVVWELQNLGLGNRARVDERRAENQLANIEFYRLQDRIAAEVAKALAEVESATARVVEAEAGLKDALFSVEKNFEGMNQTRRAGDVILLVIRPQEAVASLQALSQAYADFFGAVADSNRSQFRLYRALGNPGRQ